MSHSKFLAVDIGAESGKAFVGILSERKIILEEVHRFPNIPVWKAGHVYWDAIGLFSEVKKAMDIAVRRGHSDILSMGIDTWGVDFGFVRMHDHQVEMPFSYRDSRTNGIMERVYERIPRDEMYFKTGIQPMQINSLFQLYSVSEGCRKRFWGFEKLLFMPDIFNFFLTGKKYSEYTIASTSQLLNARSKTFDETIFSALGIPLELMCPVVMPGTIIGQLMPAIASESGLNNLEIVAVGSHDTASAIASMPVDGNDWAYLSSGSWSLIGVEMEKPMINALSLENRFTNEGGVSGKTNFLQNIMGLWLLQEFRRVWGISGQQYSYAELVELAQQSEEFKCILNPVDALFMNPRDIQAALKDFCTKTRQTFPDSRGEIVRTIFESLAFSYRAAIEKIRLTTGRNIDVLHIVGGGARNEMLNQCTADAAGIPVIAGPAEATALGNILVQAMAKGKIDSLEQGREIVDHSFQTKKYLPHDTRKWDEMYKNIPFVF